MCRTRTIPMNKLKRIAISFLALPFLFPLSGCGSSGGGQAESGWWQETSPASEAAGGASSSGSLSGFGGSLALYDAESFLLILPYAYGGGDIRWQAEIKNETDKSMDFHFTLFLNGILQPTRSEAESAPRNSQLIRLEGGESTLFSFSFDPVALWEGEENTAYACVFFPVENSEGEFSHCCAEASSKISVPSEYVKSSAADAFHAVQKITPQGPLDGSCLFSVHAEEDLSFPIDKPDCIPLQKALSVFAVVPEGPLRTYLFLDGCPVPAFGGKFCAEWDADAGALYQIPLDSSVLRPDGEEHLVHLLSFHTDDCSLRPETSFFMKAR